MLEVEVHFNARAAVDISEVSKRTGVAASTLRFYEQKGLLAAARGAGGRRCFDDDVVDRLALIALGQAGGLSLAEIQAMLPLAGAPRVDRTLLRDKANALDATLVRLTAMRDSLRHAARCPAEDHLACPTFQRLLKIAAAGRWVPATKSVKPPGGRGGKQRPR